MKMDWTLSNWLQSFPVHFVIGYAFDFWIHAIEIKSMRLLFYFKLASVWIHLMDKLKRLLEFGNKVFYRNTSWVRCSDLFFHILATFSTALLIDLNVCHKHMLHSLQLQKELHFQYNITKRISPKFSELNFRESLLKHFSNLKSFSTHKRLFGSHWFFRTSWKRDC